MDLNLIRTESAPITHVYNFGGNVQNYSQPVLSQTSTGWNRNPVNPSQNLQLVNIYRKDGNDMSNTQPNIYKTIAPDMAARAREQQNYYQQMRAPVHNFQVQSQTNIPQPVQVNYQRTQVMNTSQNIQDTRITQTVMYNPGINDRRLQTSSSVPKRVEGLAGAQVFMTRNSDPMVPPHVVTKFVQPAPQPQAQPIRTRELRSASAQIGDIYSVRYVNFY
jgi:hypothetical protein